VTTLVSFVATVATDSKPAYTAAEALPQRDSMLYFGFVLSAWNLHSSLTNIQLKLSVHIQKLFVVSFVDPQ
jgi:hypothetical protein